MNLFVVATRESKENIPFLPIVKSLMPPEYAMTRGPWRASSTPKGIEGEFGGEKIIKVNLNSDTDLVVFTENTEGLPKVYNQVLQKQPSWINIKYDVVVFVHDDVSVEHNKVFEVLKAGFGVGNTIIGLAGTSQATIKAPALWHLMSKHEDWSGAVAHPYSNGTGMTSFGPAPRRCLLLDGLFLAVNTKTRPADLLFDEQFKFHHYDLDFCLTANKLGVKMSTAPIWVTHNSPGLSSLEDKTFLSSQELFLSKWTK